MFELSFVGVIVFDGKGRDEIDYVVFVFYWVDPPVVYYEFKLVYFTVAVRNLCVTVKGLAHDGD